MLVGGVPSGNPRRDQGEEGHLRILNLRIDMGSATGELVLTLLTEIAAFERSIMLERQRKEIAKAKAEGRHEGRKPTAQAQADEVGALQAQGLGATEFATQLGIGRASVYRILSGGIKA